MDVLNLKYKFRLESFEIALESVLKTIKSDELIKTLKADDESSKYIGIRMQEIIESGLLKEKEIYINKLIEENAKLQNELDAQKKINDSIIQKHRSKIDDYKFSLSKTKKLINNLSIFYQSHFKLISDIKEIKNSFELIKKNILIMNSEINIYFQNLNTNYFKIIQNKETILINKFEKKEAIYQKNFLTDLKKLKNNLKEKYKERAKKKQIEFITKINSLISFEEKIWKKCSEIFNEIILKNPHEKNTKIKEFMNEWDDFRFKREIILKTNDSNSESSLP